MLDYIQNLPGYKKQAPPIYTYIPELKLMKKTLSYSEIYSAISRLSDPQMVFINMFKENPKENLVSGIVYFPYTPAILEHPNISSDFILKISTYLGLQCNYNISFESEKIKILKQKLIDIYYLVDDSEDLHGVTPCQGVGVNLGVSRGLTNCPNIASFFCENNLCKSCCQIMTNKEFCVLHDDMVNFYRKKMQEIIEFEHRKNFNRSRTVRISIRQRISKSELRNIFEEFDLISQSYGIDWDNLDFLFRKGVEKIQFVYLQCSSNEEARRLYEDRGKIMKKWEKLEINIQSLLENIEDIIPRVRDLTAAGLLVVPVSTVISNIKKIPKKSQRNGVFDEMIQKILKINPGDFQISNCNNNINNEFSYDYYLVEFSSKELCERFFSLQPFLDSVIFHKLSHLKFFPMLRKSTHCNSLCVNCGNISSLECIFDLCNVCCVRQKKDGLIISKLNKMNLTCPCNSVEKVKVGLKINSSHNSSFPIEESDANIQSECFFK